jgi:hypothetical protein
MMPIDAPSSTWFTTSPEWGWLIVLGKHGTHLTEELLLGSVTRQVLDAAQGDVLVVSDTRRGDVHLP